MKLKMFLAVLLLTAFTTSAAAQTKWIGDFLNRYRPPAVDPAARVTPAVSDTPWQLMVQSGTLPISVGDVIRLMLQSNLDVTLSRFSPLTSQYTIDTLFR